VLVKMNDLVGQVVVICACGGLVIVASLIIWDIARKEKKKKELMK